MLRSHQTGSLRATHAGQTVTLTGWVDRRRDHGGVAFIDLRDASGIVQVVVREDDAHALRNETVVKVTGTVSLRPEGNTNANLPTGDIEVIDTSVEILSPAEALPFQVSDHAEDAGTVGEETRLRYRYLDLRRSGPAATMRLRSAANKAARSVLDEQEFLEI
ncbi:MAG: OB-fold nucleic acid binding domain-containing protein, partial [Brevibacterium sp.]|nr:OB-fold nucleic acid binding domain-containing protein [Brevibacterium sp.]